jgi:hypothetical protein
MFTSLQFREWRSIFLIGRHVFDNNEVITPVESFSERQVYSLAMGLSSYYPGRQCIRKLKKWEYYVSTETDPIKASFVILGQSNDLYYLNFEHTS